MGRDQRPSTAMAAMPAKAAHKRMGLGWALLAALVALAIGLAAGLLLTRSDRWTQVTRTVINPPEKTDLNLSGDSAGPPVLSPDGTMIAFTATKQDGVALWVRPMDSLEARMVPGTERCDLSLLGAGQPLAGVFRGRQAENRGPERRLRRR